MRFQSNAGELAGALRTVALAVTDTASRLQSLSAVRVATMGNSASFTVHVLERCISANCAALIEREGAVAVPAEKLAKLVGGFAAKADVTLATHDGLLEVRSGRSVYRLPTVPLFDLPVVPVVAPELGRLQLTHEQALATFTVPTFCIAADGTRQYLDGLFLHHTEIGELAAVGCDGARICRLLVPAAPKLSDDRRLIIPTASIRPLVKLLRKSSGNVVLRRSKTLFELTTEEFTFISKMIDASYVDYEALIPKQESLPNRVVIDRAEFAAALARMDAVADTKVSFPLLGLEWTPGRALGLSLLRQPGTAAELLDAECVGSCRIAMSLPRLRELAGELEGRHLCLEVNGMGAVKITVPGNDQVLVLEMPVTFPFNKQQTEAA